MYIYVNGKEVNLKHRSHMCILTFVAVAFSTWRISVTLDVELIQGDCSLNWSKRQQKHLRDLTYHHDESTLGVKMSRTKIKMKYILEMGLEWCCIFVSFLNPIAALLTDTPQKSHRTKWVSSLHVLATAAPSDEKVLDDCLPSIIGEQKEFPNEEKKSSWNSITCLLLV